MDDKKQKLHKRWLPYVTSIVLFLAYVFINRLLLGVFTVCPFRALTGYPCPGCGLTHAAKALLTLDIRSSLEFHALFVPVAITLSMLFFPKGAFKMVDWARHQYWWYALMVVAMFVYFGYRLQYCFPGKYPMYRVPHYYLGKVEVKQRFIDIKNNLGRRLKRLK